MRGYTTGLCPIGFCGTLWKKQINGMESGIWIFCCLPKVNMTIILWIWECTTHYEQGDWQQIFTTPSYPTSPTPSPQLCTWPFAVACLLPPSQKTKQILVKYSTFLSSVNLWISSNINGLNSQFKKMYSLIEWVWKQYLQFSWAQDMGFTIRIDITS